MKFNVEIDLDWIEEDSTIDEEVKNQIMSSIEGKVLKKLEEKVLSSAQERIESQVKDLVDQNVNAMIREKLQDLMTLKRTVTDDYGRIKKEEFSIEQMLIDSVDGAINKKTLNDRGSYTSSTYEQKFSYFDYFTLREIPALVDKQIKALAEKTEKDIQQLVKDKIKTEVADKLTSLIVENSTALSLRSGTPN